MMNEEQQSVNVNIDQTEQIVCEECGHNTFVQSFFLRKVSAVIAGQESILPISVFECSQCGHVNQKFKPKNADGNYLV